ncbi:hypothetical protein CDEST_05682 [Colletotrichum destructivum]|uniref:Uncharacterized protein n=1 Tax=Colletotrichum destructivum TaxID=34406 RepID=A0AAX4ICK7_9PEZI|nr:hypothetical protein CDEST_05682 [Colletotrichum destructivum]
MATVAPNEMTFGQESKTGEHLSNATTQMRIISISENGAKNPDQQYEAKKKVLVDYLKEASPEFAKLDALRKKASDRFCSL